MKKDGNIDGFIGITFKSHCMKKVCIQSFPGLYFLTFGLKIDYKNSEYGLFSCSVFCKFSSYKRICNIQEVDQYLRPLCHKFIVVCFPFKCSINSFSFYCTYSQGKRMSCHLYTSTTGRA